RFSSGAREGIAISKSIDGGSTWSTPVRVNGVVGTQAFTAAVAVAQGGVVGVSYYDFRNDDPKDGAHLLATRCRATSNDGAATFQDPAESSAFDIRVAPQVTGNGSSGYFLGDYMGLVAVGSSFLPLFVIANNGNTGNRSDVFARPIGSAPAAAAFVAGEL